MGSGPPVRRFDALRACVRCGPPCGRSRAATLPALALPCRGVRRSPARSRAPVGAPRGPCTHSWGYAALRRSLGGTMRDGRGSRRDPRPRAGFGYPLRGTHRPTSRRAKRRSVHGLLPSGLVPRARRELLSESLPSWRCRPARRTVRCTRERGRLQGLALGTDPNCHRSLGDRSSLPSWGSPPQSYVPIRSGTALWSRGLPSHPVSRADVPARRGLRVSRIGWIGSVRLRTAGSRGVRHLVTVAALRSPVPGAGSWLRLGRDRDSRRDPTLLAPWRSVQPPGPGRQPGAAVCR
jgi:hypothetical protein